MAKVNIELICSCCGKNFKHVHNCINRAQAESYEEWAKDNIDTCPECFRSFKEAEREYEINKKLEGIELENLIGTEKQIAYASKIRNEAIVMVLPNKPNQKFYDAVNSKASASWWIENKDNFIGVAGFIAALTK